jgi:hypothetical protein
MPAHGGLRATGYPLHFPRTTASESEAFARGEKDCFRGYDERLAHYWAGPTEFKAAH